MEAGAGLTYDRLGPSLRRMVRWAELHVVGIGPIRTCLVAALALAAVMGHASIVSAAAGGCRGAHAAPKASPAKARKATLCLINRQRTKHGLARIRANRKLANAAARHSLDMVAEHYFDHVGPRGDDMMLRARVAHYLTPRVSWVLGENIAFGAGRAASPAGIVRQWMHSAPHRANILNPSFKDAGVGIAHGAPNGGAGATYTLDFGRIS